MISFFGCNITFMNVIANFCEKVGADVDKVRIGMGTDSRIGKRFLFPGIGYGGSCFPKDVKALYKSRQDQSYDFEILKSVIEVNDAQKRVLVPRIASYFNGELANKTLAIWGLAFNPETDDIREAPSFYMINELLKQGVKLRVFDPEAMANVKEKYGNELYYAANMYDALKGVDALIIATEWSIFRTPNFAKLRSLMTSPVIFDGRNLYDTQDLKSEGFYYESIGRKTVSDV